MELLRETIHYRKGLGSVTELGHDTIVDFERKHQEILDLVENKYKDFPLTKFYRDGYNLYKRICEYKDSHLLFLHNIRISYDNNLAERLVRIVKRKAAQVISFRSIDSLIILCESFDILLTYSKELGYRLKYSLKYLTETSLHSWAADNIRLLPVGHANRQKENPKVSHRKYSWLASSGRQGRFSR